ncbi:MAG: HlyD family efflux transporter periplasmic adaptor subunit [Spirochaetales bacterium]|nr:HlyD family efflux transporter periplasmic adaptor subunit [Spirochaetales bacterium]
MKISRQTFAVISFSAIGLYLFSCSGSNGGYDASGSFEATEIIVSAESTGKITRFDIEEGQSLEAGKYYGAIDSVQLELRKKQLLAGKKAVESRYMDLDIQTSAIEQQIATAVKEKERVETLLKSNAASRKQLDDINAQIAFLGKQLDANRANIKNTNKGISEESTSIEIQTAQLDDQINKCRISSPIDGTVLVKYSHQGEFASPGKPLFKIADINNMFLRAYITSDQLYRIKIGQEVKVFSDSGKDEMKEYSGKVVWISDKAEFTPKTIQTKNERANQVYALKIAVKNDGYLKIGMYGEIKFEE